MFNDPANQYRFELPLGWCYDSVRSHLITVRFVLFGHPRQSLTVRAMPTFAPPEIDAEGWHKVLEDQCFGPQFRPITRLQTQGLPAALAEAHEAKETPVHRRILVVRGTRLDVLVEHRTPEPSAGATLSAPLDFILRSLAVPTNHFLPDFASQAEVQKELRAAHEAAEREAWKEMVEPARRAQSAAEATYLYSVVENTPLPEIPAIVALIDALTFVARAGAGLVALRQGEHLALRALYTLRHHPLIPQHRRKEVQLALTNRLQLIGELHRAMIVGQKAPAKPPDAGLGLAVLRAEPMLEQANQFALSGMNELARWHCELAIADLFIVLGSLESEEWTEPHPLGADFAQRAAASGLEKPEDQWALFKQLSRTVQLSTLQRALTLLSSIQALTHDEAGAVETSSFLLQIANELNVPSEAPAGKVKPEDDQPARVAHALIEHASSLSGVQDEPSLEQAHSLLDQAEAILDQIGEEAVLRSWWCLVRAFTLHSQRSITGALETIERGLRAAAAAPEKTEQYVRELKTIKSQFLIHAHNLPEARKVALEVIALPEGDGPRARIDRSSHYLNLAIIEMQLGDTDAAAPSLREALRRAIEVAPFGEESFRVLMVASRLFTERAPILSERLNLAAAAALDARRARLGSDALRVGFDDSTRRREVYEQLVDRLVANDSGLEAIAAADRSRARSLNDLLAGPQRQGGLPPTLPQQKAPSLLSESVKEALGEGADYVIESSNQILRQSSAVPPLSVNELKPLAAEIAAPALLIQPVRDRIALLLLKPSGEVTTTYSPFALKKVLQWTEQVQKHLFIRVAPRGEIGGPQPPAESTALDDALAGLWKALIEPISDHLPEKGPLVLVPYRQFALIPFALLRGPGGEALIDRHSLSVVPSLATLRTLRQRPAWSRARPQKAYVAGDPAIAPRFIASGLARLPAARAEAKAVGAILQSSGVPENAIALRLDTEADEESYRREAHGADLIHLSCHAKPGLPAYTSCLYLAPKGPYDGMLLASEITDVKLNDALVFLAACETGVGRATADGVIGLGRAFLEAGARAIVLSLWKVEDAATAALSAHLYEALLKKQRGCSLAEALRAATLATRKDLAEGRILSPDHTPISVDAANWAGFTILGDGLAICYKGEE